MAGIQIFCPTVMWGILYIGRDKWLTFRGQPDMIVPSLIYMIHMYLSII